MPEDKPTAPELDATMSAPGSTAREPVGSGRSSGGADAMLAPGATLGRYVLGEPLGAGGMGMVFRARDPDLGREVAVKVLRAGEDGSGGGLERRLLREAQTMATVSHDNLANVYDIGTTGGRVFIAMELVDGGTLRQLIADRMKSWREKLAAVVAAGRGLAAAHSAGVIHRDFKPDNVLIAKNGRAKVVDFGLARADRAVVDPAELAAGGRRSLPPDLSAQLTQTGALLGTPAYMAPEQHAGDPVDARSDQFAFAVTAWEAVYGERPFATDAYSSLVAAVRAHAIIPPPKGIGVPPALEVVLRRALSPAPTDRFTSMDSLIHAIEHAIRPRRRWPWFVSVGAVLLIAGGVTTYVLASDKGDPEPSVKNRLGEGSSQVSVRVVPFDPASYHELAGADAKDVALRRLAIQGVLNLHGGELGTCFREAGLDRPGRVTIEFTIDAKGKVTSYRAVQNDFGESSVASCIGKRAMQWSFPIPSDGKPATVTFPFEFSTGPDRPSTFPDLSALGDLPQAVIAYGLAAELREEIDKVGDNHYSMPRSLATRLANDPEVPISARIVPAVRQGKQAGYRLFAIRDGSVFDELDLEDGDIVRSINGVALTSEVAARRALEAAKTAARVELGIERDGKRLAISVDVMPDEANLELDVGDLPGLRVPPVPPVPPAPAPPVPVPPRSP